MNRLSLSFALFLLIDMRTQAQSLGACSIFPANNVWNTRIDALKLDGNSAAYVATIGASAHFHADFGTDLSSGIPFNLVNGSQPKVPIVFGAQAAGESDPGPYPIPPGASIEGGSNSSGDRHVLVADTTNCVLYELYSAYPQADGSWQAYSGAVFDLKSNALRPQTWTSADAAGFPILPGLVRYDEILAGEIKHALRFTAPQTRNAFIWPARHKASSLSGAQYPPMGQRFRLKASFDISKASEIGQIILTAMQRYGIILADNGSAWFVSGTSDSRWSDDQLHQDFSLIHGSDFEAVDESGLIVDINSGQALQPGAPSVVSVSPINGLGTIATFNAVYSDPSGASNLSSVYLLFNSSLTYTGGCAVYYARASNSLYLINDAGTGTQMGVVNPGTSSPPVSNSQCTISNGGAVSMSGGNLTLPVSVVFAPAFGGAKSVYALASNNQSMYSGWQTLGNWTTATAQAPTVVSVTPMSGAGSPQTFSATYSDASGTGDLNVMFLLFNSSLSGSGACWAYYVPSSNALYLVNDAGTGTAPGVVSPGTSGGSISNSQCTIANAGAVTVSSTSLTISVSITFAPGFAGMKTVYGYAANNEGVGSGWQATGTWLPH